MTDTVDKAGLPVALVTGASSGLGKCIAQQLVRRGYRVLGTSRAKDFAPTPGVQPLTLDITSDESVRTAVETALSTYGRVDVLVNNAGHYMAGALEETSVQELNDQMEVFLVGPWRMIRAVLPSMRARGSGRIVNISSSAGSMPLPFHAAYTASKHALEGMTAALRTEARPFGVHVSYFQTTWVRTEAGHRMRRAASQEPAYALARERAIARFLGGLSRGHDPDRVGRFVADIIDTKNPQLRYRFGALARMTPLLLALLPGFLRDPMVRRFMGLSAKQVPPAFVVDDKEAIAP
jgi:NAD(P)-dependent dehydrogenase (short-subunit alcohol dehydrogenase family)